MSNTGNIHHTHKCIYYVSLLCYILIFHLFSRFFYKLYFMRFAINNKYISAYLNKLFKSLILLLIKNQLIVSTKSNNYL